MSGGVKRYRVNVNGTDTVLKLSDKDAKNYKDAVPVDSAASDSATVPVTDEADAAEAASDEGTDEKAVSAQNKARGAANKGGRGGGARNH